MAASAAGLAFLIAAVQAEGLRVGPEKQGALFRGGERNASGAEETAYVVAPVDDGLRTVLELNVAADNWNRCLTINEYLCIECDTTSDLTTQNKPVPCWSYNSEIEAIPGANPDYYDLRVTTRGTVLKWPEDAEDAFLAPADGVELYRFSEGGYRHE